MVARLFYFALRRIGAASVTLSMISRKGAVISKSAFSVFVFGIYTVILGLSFLFFPNFCLSVLGMKTTEEVWIHIVGWCAFWIGVYYVVAACSEARAFIRCTTYSRPTLIVFLAVLVMLHMVEPVIILIGAIELAFAIWTIWALRAERADSAAVK